MTSQRREEREFMFTHFPSPFPLPLSSPCPFGLPFAQPTYAEGGNIHKHPDLCHQALILLPHPHLHYDCPKLMGRACRRPLIQPHLFSFHSLEF